VAVSCPEVSVVVPTRNRLALLAATLDRVAAQRRINFEVIIVDDGGDVDVASALSTRGDSRMRLLRNEHRRGVSRTRNRGIGAAIGRWVAFCDDDDLWAPDKLRLQLDAAVGQGRRWVYAGAVQVDRGLRVQAGSPPLPPQDLWESLPRYNAVPAGASNVIVERAVLDAVGGFDEDLSHFEDWDLWLRLRTVGLPAWVPEPLVGYLAHSTNATLDGEQMLANLHRIERRNGVQVEWPRTYRYLGRTSLRAGQRAEALRYFALAAAGAGRGYDSSALRQDVRLLAEHAREVWRRRRGVGPGAAARARQRQRELTDPNKRYKDEARRWLSEQRVN